MLSDILLSIKRQLTDLHEFNPNQIEEICKLIGQYRVGKWLYPGVIKRKCGISIKQTYMVLDILERNNIIKPYYELYCSNCQKATGLIFERLGDMPQEFECEMCLESLVSIDNAILVYKVIMA